MVSAERAVALTVIVAPFSSVLPGAVVSTSVRAVAGSSSPTVVVACWKAMVAVSASRIVTRCVVWPLPVSNGPLAMDRVTVSSPSISVSLDGSKLTVLGWRRCLGRR